MKPLLFLNVLILSGCGLMNSSISSRSSSEAKTVDISITADNFDVVYDGQGSVTFNSSDITISPMAATASDETHSALVLLKTTQTTPVKDFELTVDLELTAQLRQNNAPNDWEVFWFFFNYNGAPTEKTTNYFISKPSSGGELGLAHGEIGQKFLNTDGSATTGVGERHVFKFTRSGDQFTVLRDGAAFYSATTSSAFPNKLYSQAGSIGFYSEDATVKIYSVSFKNLDTASTASSITPLLASSDLTFDLFAGTPLQVGVTNSSSVGNLFWSCNYKKLKGAFTNTSVTDCLNLAEFDSSGGLPWVPDTMDVGAYVFNFEASEVRGGFTKQSSYTQVRPQWSDNALFLLDPQFSILKTVNSQSRPVTRDLPSENDKTNAWPDLLSTNSVTLTGLNESTPWRTDIDSTTAVLHFDALHDIQGLSLPLTNLAGTQDIRLSYWVKRDSTDSNAPIALDHGNGTLESRHWLGVISSRYTDGGSEVTCDDPNPATSDWTFVTTQVVSGVLKTFVNGRQVCSQNLPATYAFVSPLKIAPKVQTFYAFAGRLSEIAGYKTSTADEIYADFVHTAERYRKSKVGRITQSGLRLHWDMANSNGGTSAPTSSTVNRISDLTKTVFSKIVGGFDGSTSSGFDYSTPARTSLVFDGSDDYIQISAHADLSLAANWTIEGWIQPGVALGNDTNYPSNDVRYPLFKTVFEQAYFDNANKLSHGFGLRIGPTNTLDMFVMNNYGFTETVQGSTSLNPNQWYHVAVSFDKATGLMKVYLNGALTNSKVMNYKQDVPGTPQSDGEILTGLSDSYVGIPADIDTRRRFNGTIGALRVYGTTLTATQVQTNCEVQHLRFGVTCN